jgi:L-alanine-DL-glutamate epimerase-like enolase superfamily enzyme
VIKPQIVGMEIEDLNQILHRVHSAMVNNNSTKAAVEIAVYDLWAKWLDKPLYKALGGWTAKQTVFALEQLEQSGLQLKLIEQPAKANDVTGMPYVTQHVSTPMMADGSTFSAKQVIERIQTGAADSINIKLMKTAGLSHAKQIADIASLYDVECMLEGSIGVAAAAHLASAKANVIRKIDLDGPALGQFDPVQGGVNFNGATITPSDGPGLGIEYIDHLQPLVNGVWL